MNLFFCPHAVAENTSVIFSPEESTHAVRVLRMKQGDDIQFVDGRGNFYSGKISEADPPAVNKEKGWRAGSKKCAVKITNVISGFGKRNFHLHIAIAPAKNSTRFEWFLEKVTEIGIDEITPVHCRYSERTSVKTERLNKILISSMKQSVKAYLPKLNEMQEFKIFLDATKKFNGQKFIAHLLQLGKETFIQLLSDATVFQKGKDALIAIGPEGGFSDEEVELAVKNNFTVVSLGHSRLRNETAGIVACTIANTLNLTN